MRTVTANKARQALGELLGRALKGEDIGIVHSETGKIVALRPVEVYSEDYASMEYGVTPKELERSYRNTVKQIKKERATGKLKEFDLREFFTVRRLHGASAGCRRRNNKTCGPPKPS